MEFSFEANMDYYPEFYAFNLVGDHNYRASIMIVPRDVVAIGKILMLSPTFPPP